MIFKFRRKEIPWEVVVSRAVEPVPTYYEDDDLDVVSMNETDTCGTYVFEVRQFHSKTSPRNAVMFARQQLLEGVALKGYNVLLQESWKLIVYRRGKMHRIEVQYSARPARVVGKPPNARPPPFMEVLQDCL